MKYIGPFLRLNSLDKDNIMNQMFYLAKESLKDLVLNSKCGVEISFKELCKSLPSLDAYSKSNYNPLLCVYKKASPKLVNKHNKLTWNDSKFKKEVDVWGNTFMTLSLLELCEYYKSFEDMDKDKYKYYKIYLELSKKQLEFYATYLRNHEGVFVNKLDSSDMVLGEYKFEDTGKPFKFSNQALLMAAYYKCATLCNDNYAEEYKSFSMDILKMFLSYKDELYNLSFGELIKVCFAFNLFYEYSNDEKITPLILDISDMICDDFLDEENLSKDDSIETQCMIFINFMFIYKKLNILKFKDICSSIYLKLKDLYDDTIGMFIKETNEKHIEYSCLDISLYLFTAMLSSREFEDESLEFIVSDVYKNQMINSGIILSWPDSPPLDDPERYSNFSLKSEDLLDEQNFRLASAPTPKSNQMASIFVKKVEYNKKKEIFKSISSSFDSTKNMFIYFLMIKFYKYFK